MYSEQEIDLSKKYLKILFRDCTKEVLLLGGWAVYLNVNDNYNDANGANYIGSKDIDIGFHIDMNWSDEKLQKSTISKWISKMKKLNFEAVSFRTVKYFDYDTLKELSIDEAKKKLDWETLKLYVDLIVDNIPPIFKKMFGFIPIDEPLLKLSLKEDGYILTKYNGIDIKIVKPQILLAMKLNSVTTRTEDYKKIKDIADIFALTWYSGININEMKRKLYLIYEKERATKIIKNFSKEELEQVAKVLNIDHNFITTVLQNLIS